MRTRRTCLVSPPKGEEGDEFTNSALVEAVNTPEDKENRRATYTKKGKKGKKKSEKENVEEEITTLTTTEGDKFTNSVLVETLNTPEDNENRRATYTRKGKKGKKISEKENIKEEESQVTATEGEEFTNSVLAETVNTPEDKENRRATYTKKGRKGKKKTEKENVEEEPKLTTSGVDDNFQNSIPDEEDSKEPERRSSRRASNIRGKKNAEKEKAGKLTTTEEEEEFTNSGLVEDLSTTDDKNSRRGTYTRKGKKRKNNSAKEATLEEEEPKPTEADDREEFTNSLPNEPDEAENRRTTFTRKGRKAKKSAEKEVIEEEKVEEVIPKPSMPVAEEFLSSIPEEMSESNDEPENRRGTFTKQTPVANVVPIWRKGTFDKIHEVPVSQGGPSSSPRTKLRDFSARLTKFSIGASPARKISQEGPASSPRTKLKEFFARETKFSIGSSPVRKVPATPLKPMTSRGKTPELRGSAIKSTIFSRKSNLTVPATPLKPLTSRGKTPELRGSAIKSTIFTRKSNLTDMAGSTIKSTIFSSTRNSTPRGSVTPLKPVPLKGRTPDLRSSAIKSKIFGPRNSNLTASKTPMKLNPTVAKTPLTNKKKAPTPFSSAKRKLGTMPDFKKIHQKQMEKMENIVDYKKRTAARGLNLLSPVATKPSRSMSMIPRPVNNSFRASSASPGRPFSRFGRPSDIKNPPTSMEKIREKERELLKGVRMNKRFMLQMQMRKLV